MGPAKRRREETVNLSRSASEWDGGTSDGRPRRGTGTIDGDVLKRLVETAVRTADPEQVILFGSAARGELTDDSD